ncbi:MAG: ATP-binding protein [Rhodococcus sp. (in: high G+C Gram-positive bacteria)]
MSVAGGTAAAMVYTAQKWIYASTQSTVTDQFRGSTDGLEGSNIELLGRSEMYALLGQSTDITAISATEGLLTVGSAQPDDIPVEFALSVSRDRDVHAQRIGTHRLLLGRTVTVDSLHFSQVREQSVQLYTIRPLPGVRDKIVHISTILVASVLIGTLMCVLAGVWFSSLLVRPLTRLDRAAKSAADGDLGVRLPTDGIPELAQVTTTFNMMLERHRDSVEQLQRFVADVSHELRTPLASLIPTAEILSEDRHLMPPETAEAAALVNTEITALAALVEDLIEISRHDAGTITLDLTPTDLPALVTDIIARRGWTTQVSMHFSPPPPVRVVDARRLEIALSNLIGNAVRHGDVPIIITLTSTPTTTIITIDDHGTGISPAHLPHIFDRFYKADGARARSGGSGLGLSLAAENIALHRGTLVASSRPGHTTFTLTLPHHRLQEGQSLFS